MEHPTSTDIADAWDARVAHLFTKLPHRVHSTVAWLRHPPRRPVRIGSALLLIVGGVLAILPILGFWMLPLGLALMSDDVPSLKIPLKTATRGIERVWRRFRVCA